MTKRDLVVRISRETGLRQEQVMEIVQRVFDYITEALAKGEKVELRNFGVFEIKLRRARVGRNPKAPANDIRIPARAVVRFKAGKKMGETVLRLTPKKVKPVKTETVEKVVRPVETLPPASPPV